MRITNGWTGQPRKFRVREKGCSCGCLWGSNTAGGGLQENENSIRGRFPILLKGWWKSVITPLTGSSLNMKVIGIGGT